MKFARNALLGASILGLAIGASSLSWGATPAAAPKKIEWNLKDAYPSLEAWNTEKSAIERAIPGLLKHKGKLGTSAAALLAALDETSLLNKRLAKLSVYASLKSDEDVRIAENSARSQIATNLGSALQEATAWQRPELLSLGADKIEAFIKAEPNLSKHAFGLRDVLRNKPHTLSLESETILAQSSNVLGQASNVYSVLANGELPFPTIKLGDGTDVKLDQAAYSRYRQAPNRADRKLVFDKFWSMWKAYEGTMGANMNAAVLANIFNAKARNYKSALTAQLFGDNLPEGVYRTLVAEVNHALPTFHRYLKLRAKMLGVKDLSYYDIYAPLTSVATVYSIEDSKRITLAALVPFGDQYLNDLKKGFAGNWMHAYPQAGKASGAYVNGAMYDLHPYVLLNHNDDYDGLSTFAHEWGHAVHSVMANRAQPWETSNYSTFIAETASITNEMLLQDYLLTTAKTDTEKLAILNEVLDSIRGTYFRQALFAEFQLKIHDMAEKGDALTGELMTKTYCDLLKRYHGDDKGVMKIDPAYCVEWAFIPHFYNGFYVFQYATSMAGSGYFADEFKTKGASARDRFLAMLSAGGSDYPYALYKKAGMDMATPTPYRALEARMNRTIDEMEKLLAAKK